jgi:hypothetical protein
MCKSFTYLVTTYFPTYLPYIEGLYLPELVIKVLKPER